MAISIELPADLEQTLRQQINDLDHTAKEAFLVQLYRQRRLTPAQLGRALGLSRFEVEGLLKRHGVYHELTAEEVARESEDLRQLRGEHADRR